MAIPMESEGLPIERTFEEQQRLLRAPQDRRTGLDSRMLCGSQEGVEVGTVPVRATTLSVLEEEPIESAADVRNQSSQNISSLPVEVEPLNTLDLTPEALQEEIADAKESEEFWIKRQEWLASVSEGGHENRLNKDDLLTEINGLSADAEEAAESWAQEYNRYYNHIEQSEKNGNAVEEKKRETILSLLDACRQTVRAAEETQKLSASLLFANHQSQAYRLTPATKTVDLRDLHKAQRAISEAPIHRRTSALDSSVLKAFIAGSSLTTAAASGMGEAFVEQGRKSFIGSIAQLCTDYPVETVATLAAIGGGTIGGGYYAWKYHFNQSATPVASNPANTSPPKGTAWSFVKVAQAAVGCAALAFSPKVFDGVIQESTLYTSYYPSWHENRVEWACKHFTQPPDSNSSSIYQKLYPLSTRYLDCSNEALIAEKATLKKQAKPKKKVEEAIEAWNNATKTADRPANIAKSKGKRGRISR